VGRICPKKRSAVINFVTALEPEAKPLIGHFLLEQTHAKPFRIFQNDSVRLIISGMRKKKSAEAVSFLQKLTGAQDEAWINVGIAGHRDHSIGMGVLIHKITDSQTQKSWYPAIIFKPPCVTESLLTVNYAESHYRDPHVYDMEASGFFESALHHSTAELVHGYKVISDNSKSSHWKVTSGFAEEMIKNCLSEIVFLGAELQKQAQKLCSLEIEAQELEPYFNRWHFTVTQRFQLKKAVRRLKTLAPSEHFFNELNTFNTSRQVLTHLNERIRNIPILL
jgi:adenosylhomocysteine nucleosidase